MIKAFLRRASGKLDIFTFLRLCVFAQRLEDVLLLAGHEPALRGVDSPAITMDLIQ